MNYVDAAEVLNKYLNVYIGKIRKHLRVESSL